MEYIPSDEHLASSSIQKRREAGRKWLTTEVLCERRSLRKEWRCLQHDQHVILLEFVLQLEVALHRPRLQAKAEVRAANLSDEVAAGGDGNGRALRRVYERQRQQPFA